MTIPSGGRRNLIVDAGQSGEDFQAILTRYAIERCPTRVPLLRMERTSARLRLGPIPTSAALAPLHALLLERTKLPLSYADASAVIENCVLPAPSACNTRERIIRSVLGRLRAASIFREPLLAFPSLHYRLLAQLGARCLWDAYRKSIKLTSEGNCKTPIPWPIMPTLNARWNDCPTN